MNKFPWCSGYHVCLTRRRSPVRSWAETDILLYIHNILLADAMLTCSFLADLCFCWFQPLYLCLFMANGLGKSLYWCWLKWFFQRFWTPVVSHSFLLSKMQSFKSSEGSLDDSAAKKCQKWNDRFRENSGSVEMRGVDPRASHMLSERSTIWATPPYHSRRWNIRHYFIIHFIFIMAQPRWVFP